MNLKRKTQLCSLLVSYQRELCKEATDRASETYDMMKCDVCDMAMSDGTCIIDKITEQINGGIAGR